MRAVIYSRVSTDVQERDGTSLDSQDAACMKHSAAAGYDVIAVIHDSASGASLERPGMDEVRRLLKAKGVDVVVSYAVDRLSRSQNHVGILFDDLQRAGCRLDLVTERFEDTAVGRFIIAARAFVAEVEREKIVERTSRGRVERAKAGFFVGPHPYGYQRIGKGIVTVDELQARVVRRIYDLYLKNIGMGIISATLNAEGARTRRGFLWTPKEVRDVLINETYAGVMKYAGQRFVGSAPAIVEREQWDAVHARIGRKREMPAGRTQVSPFLLTGILWCGECGGRMIGSTKGYRWTGSRAAHRYYICLNNRRGIAPAPNNHEATALERAVLEAVEASRDPGMASPQVTSRKSRLEADVKRLEDELRGIEGERRNLAATIARGIFATDEQARAANRDLEARRTSIEAQATAARQERDDLAAAETRAREAPERIRKVMDEATPIAERKGILQSILDSIAVYPGDPRPHITA